VTHRDIKLENIIIDVAKNQIKLIDFGFCCCTSPEIPLKVFCGTPSYMCPEIVMKREYVGPPTDIWATGVLFFALLCGQFPFRGATDRDLYRKIARGEFEFPDHVSNEASAFIRKMLVINGNMRASASTLLLEPFMSSTQSMSPKQSSENFLSTNESSGFAQNYLQHSGRLIEKSSPTNAATSGIQKITAITSASPTAQ